MSEEKTLKLRKTLELEAAALNVNPHGLTNEQLQHAINDAYANQAQYDQQEVKEKDEADLKILKKEEVESALEKYTKKDGLGFVTIYPGDNTVIIKCKGHENSFHLSTPLKRIERWSDIATKGAVGPAIVNTMGAKTIMA